MNRLLGQLTLVLALAVAPVTAQAQFMDVNSIVASIGSREFLNAVERLDSSASVRVVRLSTLNGAQLNRERLARAVASKPRDVYHLQSSIRLNQIAIWAVRNAGVSIEQIVALQASGDGAVILFADDL